MPRPKKISDIKPILTNVAQTSHYQVQFGGLPADLMRYLNTRDIQYDGVVENDFIESIKHSLNIV